MSKQILIKELAYVLSGGKGDISNVGTVAFNKENYEILRKQVTPQKVKNQYNETAKGDVKVCKLPNIDSIQLMMYHALGGGATYTLRFDEIGKAICLGILFMQVEVTDGSKSAKLPM
jgi:hypothetical protein